jgi:hypothetical protein
MEDNPFEEYYKVTLNELARDNIPQSEMTGTDTDLDFLKDPNVVADAASIKSAINIFIRKLNSFIGKVFVDEQAKGTKTSLIVTLVVGGLSFTLANVFFLISKNLGVEMTEEEYKKTFIRMYDEAIKDIGKHEKD